MKKITLLPGALILTGCTHSELVAPKPPQLKGMPNPASVYYPVVSESMRGNGIDVTINNKKPA